jgi:hypothetical protein
VEPELVALALETALMVRLVAAHFVMALAAAQVLGLMALVAPA